jgi:hypothetical protein
LPTNKPKRRNKNMSKEYKENQGYLKKLKETNPEKLKEIVQKGANAKKKKSITEKTFKDIYNGILSATVVLKDNFGNIMKDENGKPIEITQKEALAIKSINNLKDNVNLRDIKDIMEIIGEVQKDQFNDKYGLQIAAIRDEINNMALDAKAPHLKDETIYFTKKMEEQYDSRK